MAGGGKEGNGWFLCTFTMHYGLHNLQTEDLISEAEYLENNEEEKIIFQVFRCKQNTKSYKMLVNTLEDTP